MARPLAIVLLIALAGCNRALSMGGLPFLGSAARVGSVVARGGYLDAPIVDARGQLRFLFPDTPECRAVVVAEAPVEYQQTGTLGRVKRDEKKCDPAGIASLAEWRDRRPSTRGSLTATAIPREPAYWKPFYRDDEVILVRGRFLIAREVGWIGDDTVAMLPASCAAKADAGEGTVEFRPSGKVAFRVIGEPDCPILAFARPQPGSK